MPAVRIAVPRLLATGRHGIARDRRARGALSGRTDRPRLPRTRGALARLRARVHLSHADTPEAAGNPGGVRLMRTPSPVLSLILCSRNDAYMGNSRWRLETTLNFIGAEV